MTMFGYHGRYLRVDLTEGSCEWRPLSADALRRYLGGVGLATYLLHREAPVGVDPLSPAAPLIFAFSPLVGTPLTTSAKFAVVAKSPLTDRLNDALSSSHFALSAKRAGMDALVIVGSATAPSCLVIDEGKIRIESAADLWGRSAQEAAARLTERLGPQFHSAIIGVAGENLVRYATISHDNRHAGRGGLGAVMGAKKLKAIAVTGSQRVAVADPAGVVRSAKDLSRRSFGPATAKYRELGTVANLLTFNRLAALPTRNFQQGTFAEADLISGEALNQAKRVARQSCAACTIGCEHIYAAPSGPVRLEYESLFALGPLCGISDQAAVLEAAHLCDQFGLDTISTGASIAFAMECAEKGLLDEQSYSSLPPGEGRPQSFSPLPVGEGPGVRVNAPKSSGRPPNPTPGGRGELLRFGNAAQMLATIRQIALREGLGNLLADGTRRAAQRIGGDAPDFAPHVKGLEIPGYEPRALQTMALGFAVGSRGADHNRSGAYEVDFSTKVDRLHGTPDAALLAIETEDKAALMDSLILCKFLRGVFTDFFAESAALLRQVTGWDVTSDELRQTAKRIVTAKKLYNQREGWTRAEDTLPRRFLSEGLASNTDEPARLPKERLDAMIASYYKARGWDAEGQVSAELISEMFPRR
jgi:aldehyde:ferredoxin oxidoreductase